MDDITTRTIVIAVNIFVTIAIVSLVIVMFFQMREIYGVVASTDTSIYNKFDDVYSMYHGKVETGIGLLNTIKRYEDKTDIDVLIVYPNSEEIRKIVSDNNLREAEYLKNLMQKNETFNGLKYRYEDGYNVTVIANEDGSVTINFERINNG